MELAIVVALLLITTLSYHYLLRNTVFGINILKSHYHGFFIFYSYFVFIFFSSILINVIPIERFWVAFKVKQSSVFSISLIVLFVFLFFLLVLKFFSDLFPKYLKINSPTSYVIYDSKIYIRFVRYALCFCLALMLLAWKLHGQGHAFLVSAMESVSVSAMRLEITSGDRWLKFIKHFYTIVCPLLFAILFSGAYKGRKLEKIFCALMIIFISGWGGSKGPVLGLALIAFSMHMTVYQVKMSMDRVLKVFIGMILLLFITYRVVLLQYSHMVDISVFLDYFSQRMFVAQIIGVYEQFNLFLRDDSYIWHGIPFASLIKDYPVFHKDLMMISEDRIDPSTIGIKNTLFVAEAYGMGGSLLAVMSPFIIGVNFIIMFVVFFRLLQFLFPNNFEINKLIASVFLFSYLDITGGFSDFVFFKILIMLLGLLSPIWLLAYLARYRIRVSDN